MLDVTENSANTRRGKDPLTLATRRLVVKVIRRGFGEWRDGSQTTVGLSCLSKGEQKNWEGSQNSCGITGDFGRDC